MAIFQLTYLKTWLQCQPLSKRSWWLRCIIWSKIKTFRNSTTEKISGLFTQITSLPSRKMLMRLHGWNLQRLLSPNPGTSVMQRQSPTTTFSFQSLSTKGTTLLIIEKGSNPSSLKWTHKSKNQCKSTQLETPQAWSLLQSTPCLDIMKRNNEVLRFFKATTSKADNKCKRVPAFPSSQWTISKTPYMAAKPGTITL
jgi:ribosomal protein L24E